MGHVIVKILWYLLFLLVYLATSGVSVPILKAMGRPVKRQFWILEASYLISASILYLCVLILTRYSSLLIVGVFLLSAQVPIVLDTALDAVVVGQARGKYQAQLRWAIECFTIRNKALIMVIGLVALVIYCVYPIYAGVLYFANTIPSTAATLGVMRITLLTLFVGGVALMLPTQVGVLFSENSTPVVRRRLFITLLAGLLPNAVLLATLLWTFKTPPRAAARGSEAFHLTYSPVILGILAAYFVLTLLLPNVVGSLRGRSWQRQLLEQRTQPLAEAITMLRTPDMPALSQLVTKLRQRRLTFAHDDNSVALGLRLDELKAEQEAPLTAVTKGPATTATELQASPEPALMLPPPPPMADDILRLPFYQSVRERFDDSNYYLARPFDPRFQYLDWLDSTIEKLETNVKELQSKRTDTTRRNAGRSLAEDYASDSRDLTEAADQAKTHTLSAVVISTAVTTVVSVLFTSFGSWLWTHVAHSLTK